ncbi:murein biosynthesis integral membrane protein MurJ [Leekyejoonella antrihumi]|uniref:Virulence factor MviN n=1 Tax=Leekyejoonella antrihumi TaxID=1660198 RepID=A0A563DXF1_9MICO|nr:lipid II flippase MurJ [Leekyejoonella antrihumi]TWP34885.1 virulence factor MviN [Leekyejoonella antrihumi]
MTPTPRQTAGIAGAAGMIAVVTLVARAVGFGRWLVFSHSVGSTCVGEVYATANLLPNTLYEIAAGGALAAVVVPLVAGALAAGEPGRADQIASAMLTWAVSILLPLAVVLAAVADPLATAMMGDGGPDCPAHAAHDLGTTMIVVFAPQVLLYGIGITLSGVLQAHRRFLAAAIAPLLSSVVVIASYAVYGRLAVGLGNTPGALSDAAVTALAGGTTLGVVALSLPLLLPTARAGVRLRPTWRFPPGMGRKALHLAGAGVLALAAQQAAVLATAWLSDHRGSTGTLPVYQYVQAMYQLPYAVLAVPLATSAFPHLVARTHEAFSKTFPAVVAAGLLGAATLVAVAEPATGFFGALDASRAGGGSSAIGALGAGVTAYALGLPGFCAVALLLRTAYAAGRAWQGGALVALGWLISACLPFAVVGGGTHSAKTTLEALGWSCAVGMSVAGSGLVWLVAREWGADVVRPAARTLTVGVVGGALAALLGVLVGRTLQPGGLLACAVVVVLSALVTVLVYLGVLRIGDPSTGGRLLSMLGRLMPADRSEDPA